MLHKCKTCSRQRCSITFNDLPSSGSGQGEFLLIKIGQTTPKIVSNILPCSHINDSDMDFKMILSVISYSITRIRIKCGYLHFLNKNVTCIHANWKTETLVQIVQYLLLFTYNKIDNPVQTRPPPQLVRHWYHQQRVNRHWESSNPPCPFVCLAACKTLSKTTLLEHQRHP